MVVRARAAAGPGRSRAPDWRRAVLEADPRIAFAIPFGSCARGRARPDSDTDCGDRSVGQVPCVHVQAPVRDVLLDNYPGITREQILACLAYTAPVGIKIYGSDLAEFERLGTEVEAPLRDVPGTRSVFAECAARTDLDGEMC
jgi:hypothetical protein